MQTVEHATFTTRNNKERSLVDFDHVRDVNGHGFEECN